VPKKKQKSEKNTGEIIERLAESYPAAECALNHSDPFQLLSATILSAQCTDKRVNQVTPELFSRFPDPQEMAEAAPEELEELIRSTGFYRNKTKNIRAACRRLVDEFEGTVPDNMEDLVSLPGVARKTANVVLGTWFGIPSGVVVDTHVRRISKRLGLTTNDDPQKIEKDLMGLIPREEWIDFSHRLILHGRALCKAQNPRCRECPLLEICPTGTDNLLT
jgi:endonuclease-3